MIFKIVITLVFTVILYSCSKSIRTPKDLGITNGKLKEMPSSPNAVSSQTVQTDKYVDPLPFIESLEQSKKVIEKLLDSYKDVKITKNDSNYIHVIFITKIMRFKDDVEFYFDDTNRVIQFRSASRLGYSDAGVNRKRYEMIKEDYLKEKR